MSEANRAGRANVNQKSANGERSEAEVRAKRKPQTAKRKETLSRLNPVKARREAALITPSKYKLFSLTFLFPLLYYLMEIEKTIIEALCEEIAQDPSFSEKALAQAYCFPIHDLRNIINTDLFKERVAFRRLAIQKERAELFLSGKPVKDEMALAEQASKKRLLKELDNDIDGTPATRVAAAKAVLDATRKDSTVGAMILVEMAPEKFEQIFSARRTEGQLAGGSING